MQELITKKIFKMGEDDISKAQIGDVIIMKYPPKFKLSIKAEYELVNENPELLENKL
jgi:hypothetical protein